MLSFEFPFRQSLNYSVSTELQKVSWGGNKVRNVKLVYTCEDNLNMTTEMLNDSDFSSDFSGAVAGLIKFSSLHVSVKTINKSIDVVSHCITGDGIQGNCTGPGFLN